MIMPQPYFVLFSYLVASFSFMVKFCLSQVVGVVAELRSAAYSAGANSKLKLTVHKKCTRSKN